MPLTPRPVFHALSKIHQSSPLTRSEARKLLYMLKTYFRRHLDVDGEGDLAPLTDDNPARGHTRVASRGEGPLSIPGVRIRRPKSATRSAHEHFQAMLSHPLLATSATMGSASKATIDHPRKGSEPAARDLLSSFDHWMALGTVTRERATSCMAAHVRSLKDRNRAAMAEEMQKSGLGSKVLRWLSSTGKMHSENLLYDRSFLSHLIQYLVAEGKPHAVWVWLEAPLQLQKHNRTEAIVAKAAMLKDLVQSEIDFGMGLNMAVHHYLRAANITESKDVSPLAISPDELKRLVQPAGILVAQHCISTKAMVDEDHVRQLSKTLNLISSRPEYVRARLLLSSPATRDPEPALAFLREAAEKPVEEMLHLEQDRKRGQKHAQRIMVSLGLRTAQRLLELDRLGDAEWILQFLQWRFPIQTGAASSLASATPMHDGPSHVKDEEQERVSLELLEKLRVG